MRKTVDFPFVAALVLSVGAMGIAAFHNSRELTVVGFLAQTFVWCCIGIANAIERKGGRP